MIFTTKGRSTLVSHLTLKNYFSSLWHKTWLIVTFPKFIQQYKEILKKGEFKERSQTALSVVSFDQLLGACTNQRLVKLLFSAVFNLFLLILNIFSDFTAEINKNIFKWTEIFFSIFCLLLKAGRHAKAGRLPEGVPWIWLFLVDFSSSTSFRVLQAPKSWSKYTTSVHCSFITLRLTQLH